MYCDSYFIIHTLYKQTNSLGVPSNQRYEYRNTNLIKSCFESTVLDCVDLPLNYLEKLFPYIPIHTRLLKRHPQTNHTGEKK